MRHRATMLAAVGEGPRIRAASPTQSSRRDRASLGALLLTLLLAVATSVLADSPLVIGTASLASMLALILMNVPVGVAMIGCAILGIAEISGWGVAASSMGSLPFSSVSSWTFSVLPMFVFMGLMLWRTNLTQDLFAAIRRWLHWLPGSVALTTNWAGAGLGAISGSTMGIAHAITRIALPEMLRTGYDPRLATGAVLMAGTGGQLLPPSVFMVVYAGIAGQPVGVQLLAGLLPGVVLALLYAVAIVGVATVRPELCPRSSAHVPSGSKWRLTLRAWPAPTLFVLVVGGIAFGVFTATEAGAFGGAAVIALGAIKLAPSDFVRALHRSLRDTAVTTAALMLLVIGAGLVMRLMALSGVTQLLERYVSGMGISRVWFLLLLCLMYLVLGMLLDPLTAMLLTVPVLLPTLSSFGISAVWFGVFVVLLMELSVVTPPVGILSFVVARVAREPDIREIRQVTLQHVFEGAVWFLPAALALIALMIAFPDLVTWLPDTFL